MPARTPIRPAAALLVLGLLSGPSLPAEPAEAPPPRPAARLHVVRGESLLQLTEDGKEVGRYTAPKRDDLRWVFGPVSPDGRRVVLWPLPKEPVSPATVPVFLAPVDGSRPPNEVARGVPADSFRWTPDGRFLIASRSVYGGPFGRGYPRNVLIDLESGERGDVALSDSEFSFEKDHRVGTHLVCDVSPDGRWFATRDGHAWGGFHGRLYLVSRDGNTFRPQLDEGAEVLAARFSPDGRAVAYTQVGHRQPGKQRCGLYVLDLDTREAGLLEATVPVRGEPLAAGWRVAGFEWRPDGKRIAYLRSRVVRAGDPGRPTTCELVTCDPDGGRRRTILEAEVTPGQPSYLLDWR